MKRALDRLEHEGLIRRVRRGGYEFSDALFGRFVREMSARWLGRSPQRGKLAAPVMHLMGQAPRAEGYSVGHEVGYTRATQDGHPLP